MTFIYPSEKTRNQRNFCKKLGILALKEGDPKSKKHQLLIDKLIEKHFSLTL